MSVKFLSTSGHNSIFNDIVPARDIIELVTSVFLFVAVAILCE